MKVWSNGPHPGQMHIEIKLLKTESEFMAVHRESCELSSGR